MKRVPAEAFPPSEFIREELDAREWTQQDLARAMDVSQRALHEIISEGQRITPEMARRLSNAFGDNDPQFWLNLDAAYRQRELASSEAAKR